MSSIFADQQRPRIRVQLWGDGGGEGCVVSLFSLLVMSIAVHNKLWKSTSIFNYDLPLFMRSESHAAVLCAS